MPKTDAIPDLPFAMDSDDLEMLRRAADHLEHPSLAARLSGVIGTPVEVALQLLPRRWYKRIHATAEAALFKALHAATGSMHREDPIPAAVNFDRLVGAATGAAGGFFGLPGLLVELPVTTTLILRSIADIARSEGEDLRSPDSLRACVEVFALGGRSESDDAAETGYY
ncbi:MAG: EcsC family protein, partial [Pseudomonadota bacterium]